MRSSKELTNIEKEQIVKLYTDGTYPKDIGKLYNINPRIVLHIVRKMGSKCKHSKAVRKYTFDEDFFDQIDSQEKAYFLGFLYADGCNYKGKTIRIGLAHEDKDILEKFNICLNSNILIESTPKRKQYFKRGGFYTCQKQAILRINSVRLSQALARLGCTNAKTFTLKFPTNTQVPEQFLSHFIRGYFDGDGSIHVPLNKKGCIITIVGTFDFCNVLKIYLEKQLSIKLSFNKYKDHKFYTIQSGSIPNINLILDFLYKNATVYLDRKFKKYKDFLIYKIPLYKTRGKRRMKLYNSILEHQNKTGA